MSDEQLRWYPSKIDWWVLPALWLPALATVAICVPFALGGMMLELLVSVAVAVLLVGIYLGLLFPMKYGLDDTHLVVRFGLCRLRVPLADISEVRPTNNPQSAPALSLDRVHLKYGQGFFKEVMISPTDRNDFLDELARRAGLNREGDWLVRA